MSLFKKIAGIFTGGDTKVQKSKEIGQISQALMRKGQGFGETSAQVEGRQQSAKAMGDLSSAVQSASGMSGALKQALIAREGRKMLGDVAMGTASSAAQERAQATRDALGAYQGQQSVAMQADEANRKRRAQFVQGLMSGASDYMTAGVE